MSTTTTLSLHSAVGIVNTFMEEQEKVTHCEVPGCNKKLFGKTFMCCRPQENVHDMSHKGHTCCEECAFHEAYIESNRCKACLYVATGRRSGTKGAGYPLQPPQLNTLATNMLKMLRDTEESVIVAREQEDAARRQVGVERRAAAVEEVQERKRKRELEALEAAEEEAKRAKLAEAKAQKQVEEAEAKAQKQLADMEALAQKQLAEAEAKAQKMAKETEAKVRKELAEAKTSRQGANLQEHTSKKSEVSEEVRKERAQRAKNYREKKKEEDAMLREQAEMLDRYVAMYQKTLEMACLKIASLGGNADEWECEVIGACDKLEEEEEEEEVETMVE